MASLFTRHFHLCCRRGLSALNHRTPSIDLLVSRIGTRRQSPVVGAGRTYCSLPAPGEGGKVSARLSQMQQLLQQAEERAASFSDEPTPRITLDHVTVNFARSGGPGGQNVNKVVYDFCKFKSYKNWSDLHTYWLDPATKTSVRSFKCRKLMIFQLLDQCDDQKSMEIQGRVWHGAFYHVQSGYEKKQIKLKM